LGAEIAGLQEAIRRSVAVFNQEKNTPGFAPPELHRGGPVNEDTDIFCLGRNFLWMIMKPDKRHLFPRTLATTAIREEFQEFIPMVTAMTRTRHSERRHTLEEVFGDLMRIRG
jgi:hypothetical protein